jgi:hypothetical protein
MEPEEQLFDEVAGFERDPLGFVEFAFPWGEGELAGHDGPMEWQREVLIAIRNGMSIEHALRIAVASGHGIGKSALVSWIILWALATFPDTVGVVTANTAVQLKTKTWVQLAKWHRLCICGHWFAVTSTAIFAADPAHQLTWRIDAVSWSEHRTEAFAGLHNHGKRILLLFDEASAIPDVIWETSEGALTDKATEILWCAFGNPTRNTGRFRECLAGGRFHHRWQARQVDSRSVPITNKEEIAEWERDYGEDSDFFRVRVKGMLPRTGSMQFISSELVDAAIKREATSTLLDPLVMGVDVARFGDDKTVIRFRRGRDARSIPPVKLLKQDGRQVAGKIAELWGRYQPDAIFVDGGGEGASAVDHLRYLKIPFIDVAFGAAADSDNLGYVGDTAYANKRAQMWGAMKAWLPYAAIDDDLELRADLPAVEYGYTLKNGRDCLILEKKEHMRKRGLASPDDGDALALTFAHPVGPSDHSHQFGGVVTHQVEYRPYG